MIQLKEKLIIYFQNKLFYLRLKKLIYEIILLKKYKIIN